LYNVLRTMYVMLVKSMPNWIWFICLLYFNCHRAMSSDNCLSMKHICYYKQNNCDSSVDSLQYMSLMSLVLIELKIIKRWWRHLKLLLSFGLTKFSHTGYYDFINNWYDKNDQYELTWICYWTYDEDCFVWFNMWFNDYLSSARWFNYVVHTFVQF